MPLPAPLLGEGLIWHPRARRCQLNTRYAIRLILPSRLQDPTRELQTGYQPLKPRFMAWGRRAQKPALTRTLCSYVPDCKVQVRDDT